MPQHRGWWWGHYTTLALPNQNNIQHRINAPSPSLKRSLQSEVQSAVALPSRAQNRIHMIDSDSIGPSKALTEPSSSC